MGTMRRATAVAALGGFLMACTGPARVAPPRALPWPPPPVMRPGDTLVLTVVPDPPEIQYTLAGNDLGTEVRASMARGARSGAEGGMAFLLSPAPFIGPMAMAVGLVGGALLGAPMGALRVAYRAPSRAETEQVQAALRDSVVQESLESQIADQMVQLARERKGVWVVPARLAMVPGEDEAPPTAAARARLLLRLTRVGLVRQEPGGQEGRLTVSVDAHLVREADRAPLVAWSVERDEVGILFGRAGVDGALMRTVLGRLAREVAEKAVRIGLGPMPEPLDPEPGAAR